MNRNPIYSGSCLLRFDCIWFPEKILELLVILWIGILHPIETMIIRLNIFTESSNFKCFWKKSKYLNFWKLMKKSDMKLFMYDVILSWISGFSESLVIHVIRYKLKIGWKYVFVFYSVNFSRLMLTGLC